MKKIAAVLLSILSILFLWQLLACKVNSSLILPYPESVFKQIFLLLADKSFWPIFITTFGRVIISFAISVASGIIAGVLFFLFPFVRDFFSFPLSVIRSTPVVAFILIALYWFSSSSICILIAVIMTLPVIISSVYSGLSTDTEKLNQMAKIFDYSLLQRLIYIHFPAARTSIINGIISIFGISWKVVVAAEVLTLPKSGTGTLLQRAQVHLETTQIIACTIILVGFSFCLERILSFVLKRVLK